MNVFRFFDKRKTAGERIGHLVGGPRQLAAVDPII